MSFDMTWSIFYGILFISFIIFSSHLALSFLMVYVQ